MFEDIRALAEMLGISEEELLRTAKQSFPKNNNQKAADKIGDMLRRYGKE